MIRCLRILRPSTAAGAGPVFAALLLAALPLNGCHSLGWRGAEEEAPQASCEAAAMIHVAPARTPLVIRVRFDPQCVPPDLVGMFAEELAAAMTTSQQFAVTLAPLIAPNGQPEPNGWADPTGGMAAGSLVLDAHVAYIRSYQPMLVRGEFELHDLYSLEPGVRVQGTWDAPTFPPNAATGPVRRFRSTRLPVQMLEEELPLISTSPRFFTRYAAGTIGAGLTEAWNARYAPAIVGTR